MNAISIDLRKLLHYLNGTGISTVLILLLIRVFPVIFTLNVNDLEYVM